MSSENEQDKPKPEKEEKTRDDPSQDVHHDDQRENPLRQSPRHDPGQNIPDE